MMDRRRKLIILIAITVLAGFLRLHRIESLPPGDRYDPAFYGVDALRVLSGEWPIFFYDYAGAHAVEPLFSYLVALSFLIVGPSTLGIHLTATLVGLVTIPAVYLAAEALFASLPRQESLLKHWGSPVAALAMALSYWHLTWSRYGVRAILVPLFAALVTASLWWGLQDVESGREPRPFLRRSFVVCGILLGMSLYTYQAARVLPALVGVGFAAVAWTCGRVTRDVWVNLLVVATVAFLVFAPLGIYFLRHPDRFFSRAETVFVIEHSQEVGDNVVSLLNQVKRAALSFVVGVDDAPYRTLPGRPSLNPFFSVLLLLGIMLSVMRIRRPAHFFLLAWLLVLTIPAALADQGAAAKRAIGALPAVAMLIAAGVMTPWDALRRKLGNRSLGRWLARIWGAVIIAGFIYSGVKTYRDYFIEWASLPDLPTHFEVDRATIGEYAGDLPPHERIYISPEVPSHPVIRFHSGLRKGIQGYNGRVCFVVPERVYSATTYIIAPGQDQHSLDLLESTVPEGSVVERGGCRTGDPAFVAYRVPAGCEAQLPKMRQVSASWGNRVQLLGYDVNRHGFDPGETIELTLYYRVLKETDQRHTAFVHLLGPENPASGEPLWAQNDSEPCHGFYPTSSWIRGEIIVDRIDLMVPERAPAHDYRLGMGFYETGSGRRLPAEGDSVTEHNVVMLTEIQVYGHTDH